MQMVKGIPTIYTIISLQKKYIRTYLASRRKMIFGIQGGRGSFNEQALELYCTEQNITGYATHYLYTTENVMKAIQNGSIDYGVFALVNSQGGLVDESLDALGTYIFTVVADVNLPITHVLMARKDIPWYEVTTIMAHPQVFAQCHNTLARHYTRYQLISGTGDLIDTAKVAESLANGDIKNHIAVLGSRFLAGLYDLQIIAENLQDKDDNMTRFLIIKK